MTNELGLNDVILVTSENRNKVGKVIKENFDANSREKKNQYNIILTSDVLAEGVNLHRSNVIVNYDSPWNATRLMQRIGRVNRIGSVADNIYNYMFYPSQQGNKEIQLYENALLKLQGFHSAFGEDAQIYSREEIVKQFEMFDSNVHDAVDKKIQLLREVRELYNKDRKLYNKIKSLPMKSRVMRDTGKHSGESVVFVSSDIKTEFYRVTKTLSMPIDFLEAVKYLKAKPEEAPAPFGSDNLHFEHVNRALESYTYAVMESTDDHTAKRADLDKISLIANKFLRTIKQITDDVELKEKEPPEFLYHGTGEKYVGSIDNQGLISKNRLYVHLSKDIETAKKVGKRHGKEFIYGVNSGKMYLDGFKFYLSVNGVWLTKEVPVKYLEKLS